MQQSAVAVRQNEDMRTISAWAAIALVPTAIAGIYGMNFDNMPELTREYGYFLVLAVIATACLWLHRYAEGRQPSSPGSLPSASSETTLKASSRWTSTWLPFSSVTSIS